MGGDAQNPLREQAMTQAFKSPADFASWVAVEGLATNGGKVKLNKYMSQSESNGGSYTSQDLSNKLNVLMKKVGGQPAFKNYIRMSTGQGYINDFIDLWNWMHAHLSDVRTLKVQTYSVKKKPAGEEGFDKIAGKVLDLAQVFKEGRPFPAAMGELIDNGCFGWDCIGFVSQYLIHIGHLSEYPTWKSNDYHTHGKFTPIKVIDYVSPCSVLVFGDKHIVLVSLVDYVVVDETTGTFTAKVSISQSYTGGPHTRKDCILTQSPLGNGRWGPINQTGVLDIQSKCTVGTHADIDIQYPPYVAR
jgi:hypothetical protein